MPAQRKGRVVLHAAENARGDHVSPGDRRAETTPEKINWALGMMLDPWYEDNLVCPRDHLRLEQKG